MFRSSKSYVVGAVALLSSACIPGFNLPPFPPGGGPGTNPPVDVNPPTSDEFTEAKTLVLLSMDALQQVHAALDLLGIIPVYECGESRATFVGDIVPQLQSQLGCAQITTSAQADSDSVILSFPQEGCDVGDHTLSGQVVFTYSGGEDRMDLVLNATGLNIDGDAVQVSGGYSTCGDQESYFVSVAGALPGQSGATFALDASVTVQEGFPIFGSPTLIFDGVGQLNTNAGTTQLTLDNVEYQPGDIIPQSGVVTLDTASGHSIVATFVTNSSFFQSISVAIDDRDLVTIPLLAL
jgi:hypothetical protein